MIERDWRSPDRVRRSNRQREPKTRWPTRENWGAGGEDRRRYLRTEIQNAKRSESCRFRANPLLLVIMPNWEDVAVKLGLLQFG